MSVSIHHFRSCMVVVGWSDSERLYPLGTVVSRWFGSKRRTKKQGVVRGYRDDFGTGRTINWVVFDVPRIEMYDEEIGNPKIPGRWELWVSRGVFAECAF